MKNVINKFLQEIGVYVVFFIENFPGKIGFLLRRHITLSFLKNKGKNIFIGQMNKFYKMNNIEIGDNFKSLHSCTFYANNGIIKIGNNVAFNFNVCINAAEGGNIIIEDNVLIAANVVIRAADHNYKNVKKPINKQGHTAGKIIIENGSWICSNVVITKNVKIGKNAVVGAGAVVTKDVNANTVVGGNPAKLIKNI